MSSQRQTKSFRVPARMRMMVQGDFSDLAYQPSRTWESEVSSERVIESAGNLMNEVHKRRLFRGERHRVARRNENLPLCRRLCPLNCLVDCSETSDFPIIHSGVVITLIVP